ncbi:methyltransferase-like protein 23 isoform X2 [Salvia splendens]|nr:methyltransferase-like protein 23 isoform X2 [Salvia splendens]XP_042067686.1 methyltransferase-like protein 23 isoform X2 [Salvia splendens]
MASRSQSNGHSFCLEPEFKQEEGNKSPGIEKDDEIEDSVESSPNRDMTTYSQHYFGSIKDGFSISIIENMKEEYGLFVWPSSVILAEYVWQQKSRFSGVNVVELGAGTSLPGLIASKVGADVTLTDDLSKAEVLSNMRRVCNINDIKCKVMGVTWGVFESPIFTLHPKIILGADVLYDTSGFDDLFLTVTFLLQKCPDSVFITTYHNRSGHHLIEFLMEKWRLKCTKLLDGFSSFLPPHKASKLSGDIQLAEIVLDETSLR